MFSFNSENIENLEGDLMLFKSRALPFATKKTINDAAVQTQEIIRADLDKQMVMRNTFTKRSIMVDKTKTLNIRKQQSVIGSIAWYMEEQEFGGVKNKSGKEGVSIPTSYSAGQGMKSQPRTRMPRKANKLANISLRHKRTKGNVRKQRNILAIKQAAESGRKFLFLEMKRTKGIFRVVDGKRKPKIRMVHDLTRQSVVIPKNPWLKPAFDEVITSGMMRAFYADALRYQLRRHGIMQR